MPNDFGVGTWHVLRSAERKLISTGRFTNFELSFLRQSERPLRVDLGLRQRFRYFADSMDILGRPRTLLDGGPCSHQIHVIIN
jgi:hypothetical protein